MHRVVHPPSEDVPRGCRVVRGFGPVRGVSTPTRRPAVRQRPHRCGPESPSRNTPTAPDVPMTGRPRHDHARRRTRDDRPRRSLAPPAVAVPTAAARSRERPGVGPAGPARPAGRDRRALPVGAGRVRLGELLLLGRGAGRLGELEGVLLRLVGRGQLDHRRQDARRRCG